MDEWGFTIADSSKSSLLDVGYKEGHKQQHITGCGRLMANGD